MLCRVLLVLGCYWNKVRGSGGAEVLNYGGLSASKYLKVHGIPASRVNAARIWIQAGKCRDRGDTIDLDPLVRYQVGEWFLTNQKLLYVTTFWDPFCRIQKARDRAKSCSTVDNNKLYARWGIESKVLGSLSDS